MKNIFILTLVLFIITPNLIISQQTWTLEDCINYAHQNNIQIKRQELAADVAKNNYSRSKFEVLPDLNAGYSRDWNYGRYVDPFTNDFITQNTISDDYYAQSNLNLFNGFQTYNSIQAAKYRFLSNKEEVEKVKNDITLQIAMSYLQILFSKELLEIARNQYDVTLLQVEKTKKMVDVGNMARGELYRMEALAASEKLNITNANNNLKLSYLDLTQLLDLDSAEGFEIVQPVNLDILTAETLSDVNTIYQQALENLPQIKSSEFMLKNSEKNLAVQRGKRSLHLSLQGTYYTGYSNARDQIDINAPYDEFVGYVHGDENQEVTKPSFRTMKYPYLDQLSDNTYKSLSFSLGIPIFNKRLVENQISNAKISVLDAKYELELSKQILYKEIQQAHTDAIAALDKYKASYEAVKANEEAFKYTQQKFDVGLVNSVDYNIAKTDLLKTRSELAQAKFEYIFKIKILDFYAGKQIII